MPRIRGSEVKIQVVVDGKLQRGSFAKVENFKLTPRIDLVDSDFLGEKESEPDLQFHGFDFSFTVHEEDSACAELLDSIIANETAGLPPRKVNIVVRKSYRDGVTPDRVDTLTRCILKPDDDSQGGRKEYVKWTYSGKCRKKKQLPA